MISNYNYSKLRDLYLEKQNINIINGMRIICIEKEERNVRNVTEYLDFFLIFYVFSLLDTDGILDICSIVIRITKLPTYYYQFVFANSVIVQYLID